MDYSLYLVTEKLEFDESNNGRNVINSMDGKETYHVGIIDYL